MTNNAWKLSYGDGRKGKRGRFYREWNILCKNENGEEEVWRISNFTYKMNKERYRIYSSKRFKARQALTQELMEISFAVVEEEVHNEIVKEGLTEEEQQNVINSLANIEKRLLETYGENASFEILHAEYTVKYADGVKL